MKLRIQVIKGYQFWVLDCGIVGGTRRKKYFHSEKEAADAMAKESKDRSKIGDRWASLTAQERLNIVTILDEMRDHATTLPAVWDAWKSSESMKRAGDSCPSLGILADETVTAKQQGGRRPKYVKALKAYLKTFCEGRESMPAARIATIDIENWFSGRNEKPVTRASNLGKLSAMFALAYRRGYIPSNPCDRVERVRIENATPAILFPDVAKKLLKLVLKKKFRVIRPWLALAMFAGIRPDELQRLKWSDIDLATGTVRIDAAASKVRLRRVLTLHDTAKAWLAPGRKAGPIAPPYPTLRRYRRALAKAAHVEWKQDILRHTAASYLLALHRDAPRVAFSLGNSPAILLRHYQELVTAEQAATFWAMTPKKVKDA